MQVFLELLKLFKNNKENYFYLSFEKTALKNIICRKNLKQKHSENMQCCRMTAVLLTLDSF